MASKVTRTAVIAVSALGAGGLVATVAQAAPPTIPSTLVNQPAVSGVSDLTPESAVLHGVVDTGGNPMSAFTIAQYGFLTWDNSFVLSGGTAASGTKFDVDGLPTNDSDDTYPTSGAQSLVNVGAGNYSTVTFEYDPLADYVRHHDNPGPETGFASEVNAPTVAGLSAVSAPIGGFPAASATSLSGALTPNTKYVYFIVQQAGATNQAETVNTFNPNSSTAATSPNPSYSCLPDAYVNQVAPYDTYTSTGTLSGGVNSAGQPNTTPQPEIQAGSCIYYYGSGSRYYDSNPGSFTTPKLGTVSVSNAVITAVKKTLSSTSAATTTNPKTTQRTVLTHIGAAVIVRDRSVEAAKGNFELSRGSHKVGYASFSVVAGGTQAVRVALTGYGKKLVATDRTYTVRITKYTTSTDQPASTRSIKL